MQFSDKERDVDVCVVGTGLTNCILSAALSRSGKRVLHIDKNNVYGGLWSSLNFKGFREWFDEEGDSYSTPQGFQYRYDISYLPATENVVTRTEATTPEEKNVEKEDNTSTSIGGEKSPYTATDETTYTGESVQETKETDGDETKCEDEEEIKSEVILSRTEKVLETVDLKHSLNTVITYKSLDCNPYGNYEVPRPENQVDSSEKKEEKTQEDETTTKKTEKKTQEELPPLTKEEERKIVLDLLQQRNNGFSIDLIPRFAFARSRFVELCLQSSISRYLEFQGLKVLQMYDRETNSFLSVPTTKAAVFQSKTLTVFEKRALMKFITSCFSQSSSFQSPAQTGKDKYEAEKTVASQVRGSSSSGSSNPATSSFDNAKADSSELSEQSFEAFLDSFKLSRRLKDYVIYVICLEDKKCSLTKDEGMAKIGRYLDSLQRFGAGAEILYPMYGTGDIGQAFTRLGALHETIFALQLGISKVEMVRETTVKVKKVKKDKRGSAAASATVNAKTGTTPERSPARDEGEKEVVKETIQIVNDTEKISNECGKSRTKSSENEGDLLSEESTIKTEDNKIFATLSSCDLIRCGELIASPEYLFLRDLKEQSNDKTEQSNDDSLVANLVQSVSKKMTSASGCKGSEGTVSILRLTLVCTAPLMDTSGGFGMCILSPDENEEVSSPIQIVQLENNTGTTPRGYYLLQVMQKFSRDGEKDIVAREEDISALENLDRILSEMMKSQNIPVCCRAKYIQKYIQRSSGCPSGGKANSSANSSDSLGGSADASGSPAQSEGHNDGPSVKVIPTQYPSACSLLDDELREAEEIFYRLVPEGCRFLEKPHYIEKEEKQKKQEAESMFEGFTKGVEEALLQKDEPPTVEQSIQETGGNGAASKVEQVVAKTNGKADAAVAETAKVKSSTAVSVSDVEPLVAGETPVVRSNFGSIA